MSKLIIVRGLPGSGKSTFAFGLAKERYPRAILLAADDWFTDPEGNYNWDPKKTGDAHKWCQKKARQGLENARNVIVHNTFTMSKEFDPYLRMVADTKSDLQVYNLFDGGLTDAELAERNQHSVPEEAITRMRNRWTNAPVSEIHVHSDDGHVYWQYPQADWIAMTDENGIITPVEAS